MRYLLDQDNNYDMSSELSLDPKETAYKQKRYVPFQNDRMSLHNQPPLNHRRQYVDVTEPPRPFGHVLKGNRPTSFRPRPNVTFPNIPMDYAGHVDSIQDIISQISNQIQSSRFESLPAYVSRTGRKVRFGGKYRHRKTDIIPPRINHDLTNFRSQPPISLTPTPPLIGNDPFYPYKPQSMADINLMAMNEFRFAPHPSIIIGSENRKQITKPRNLVSDIYQQLIRANNMRNEADRIASRDGQMKTKTKPFSLMLDVYPIHDEESPPFPSTTTKRPDKRPVLRKPQHFDNEPSQNVPSSINNFPLHYEQQYFRNINFPQINPYRNPTKNYQQESENYYNSKYSNYHFNRLGAAAHYPISHSNENHPSQITVHLNLFPKNKHSTLNQRKDKIKADDFTMTDNNGKFTERKLSSRISRPRNMQSEKDVKSLNQVAERPHVSMFNEPSSGLEETLTSESIVTELTSAVTNLSTHRTTPAEIENSQPVTSEIPTQPTTLPTISPTKSHICSSRKNHIRFNDHQRVPISTVLPIDPRELSEFSK